MRAVVYLCLGLVLGGAVMALCGQCGRKLAPREMKLTPRWAKAYRYCQCNVRPEPVELSCDERFHVWELFARMSNPVHDYCDRETCEVCKR